MKDIPPPEPIVIACPNKECITVGYTEPTYYEEGDSCPNCDKPMKDLRNEEQ